MVDVLHAQMAVLAGRLLRAELRKDDNCPLTKALECATWAAMEEHVGMTAKAFVEAAVDQGVNAATARTRFYKARKEWHNAI